MQLTKPKPNRIHAIDCRCRGCNAPARSIYKKDVASWRMWAASLALGLAVWGAVAWLAWEAIR